MDHTGMDGLLKLYYYCYISKRGVWGCGICESVQFVYMVCTYMCMHIFA